MYISHRENTTFLQYEGGKKDLTSAIVLSLFPYNLLCCHLLIGVKSVYFLEFFQLRRFENGCIYVTSNLY